MNIVYLGTPDFSVLPLKKIIEDGKHKVIACVCNKDKPVGRKQVLTPPPVKVFAEQYNIPVYQYDKIRLEGVEDMKKLNPDIMITCAFGQILSQEILDIPRLGVINIHASLLPKYRGASPIHYAILNGEKETGVTIMKTDAGIDTGDIILSEKISILEDETSGELFCRLSVLGADCIIKALDLIDKNNVNYVRQNDSEATFSRVIKKELALIDWNKTSVEIKNQVRAFNPTPGAFTFINGEQLKIYKVEISDGKGQAGEILDCEKNFEVATQNGSVKILSLQKAGGKIMDVSEFLRGSRLVKGGFLGRC